MLNYFILYNSYSASHSCPPCTSLVTRKKLLEFVWEVMPHLPYSSDLAPSDYHLFRLLRNHLDGKTFDSNEAVKNELVQFLPSKKQTFYKILGNIGKISSCSEKHNKSSLNSFGWL